MNGQSKDNKPDVIERLKLRFRQHADRKAASDAERIKAAARAEADKILQAAKATQEKASAALKDVKSRYADVSARVAAGEKRLKELNALLCPKALEAQYSKLTDPKTKAAFRKRYAAELGLVKR